LADMAPGGVELAKRDPAHVIDRAVRRRIVELVFVAEFGVQQLRAGADRRMPATNSVLSNFMLSSQYMCLGVIRLCTLVIKIFIQASTLPGANRTCLTMAV
jgi:hypothetical protein